MPPSETRLRGVLSHRYLAPALFVVAGWALVAIVGPHLQHNGWVYYNGGDETWYYTSAWALSTGHLPWAYIGYLYSLLIAPIALVAGQSIVSGLPAIVLLNVLVLGTIATVAMYGIGSRIGGRPIAIATAALWVVGPFLTPFYFRHDYHETWSTFLLPQLVGLTSLGDYPSLVFVVAAAYFCLRALDSGWAVDAAAAGLLAGLAALVKPANVIFLIAPVLAFVVAGRKAWPRALVYGAAVLPGLLALGVWKYRGLGYLPAIHPNPPVRTALGQHLIAAGGWNGHVTIDWHHLYNNFLQFREFGWSLWVVEWVVVAGLIAVARRSLAKSVLLGAWFGSYLLVKGSSQLANVSDTTFFRFIMPALPVFAILIASLPLLVPRSRVLRLDVATPARGRVSRVTVIAASALVGIALLVAAVLPPLASPRTMQFPAGDVYAPVANNLVVRATQVGKNVLLTWSDVRAQRARSFYIVYREIPDGYTCTRVGSAPVDCKLIAATVAATRGTSAVDPNVAPGVYSYHLALATNYKNSVQLSTDVYLLGPAVTITVR